MRIKMLLSIGRDAKTIKGEKVGFKTGILYLTPGSWRCPFASEGCRKGCLNTAGRGGMTCTQKARQRRTLLLEKSPTVFNMLLKQELKLFEKRWKGYNKCVRLNGTSDIDFKSIRSSLSSLIFYDYTKSLKRAIKYKLLSYITPKSKRYYLVYSLKETDKTWKIWLNFLLGINTAVVFRKDLPKRYKGIKVISGDETDLRFLDPPRVIVGLKAKGKAKKDFTGFVKL